MSLGYKPGLYGLATKHKASKMLLVASRAVLPGAWLASLGLDVSRGIQSYRWLMERAIETNNRNWLQRYRACAQ